MKRGDENFLPVDLGWLLIAPGVKGSFRSDLVSCCYKGTRHDCLCALLKRNLFCCSDIRCSYPSECSSGFSARRMEGEMTNSPPRFFGFASRLWGECANTYSEALFLAATCLEENSDLIKNDFVFYISFATWLTLFANGEKFERSLVNLFLLSVWISALTFNFAIASGPKTLS